MRIVLIGLLSVCSLGALPAWAQSSTGVAPAPQSDQQFACQQKVTQLTEQTRPLQTKLSTLRTERRGIGASGGEVARFKLANLDQEISQLSKQLDGVNGQIAAEKKHCDELAGKPAHAAPAATQKNSPQKRRN